MKTIAWLSKYVVLPLTPFLVGILVRSLQRGVVSFDLLSPAELSFSMAMLSLVLSVNTSKLSDPASRASLTQMYQLGVVVFLVLFSCSVFLEADIQYSLRSAWVTASAASTSGATLDPHSLPSRISEFEEVLGRFRWVTVAFTLLVIPLALYSNRKYDLEDL